MEGRVMRKGGREGGRTVRDKRVWGWGEEEGGAERRERGEEWRERREKRNRASQDYPTGTVWARTRLHVYMGLD